MDYKEQLSTLTHFRHSREHWYQESVYEDGFVMGIQQCEDKGGRQVEGSVYNTRRVIQTNCDVLWINQFTGNISNYDE